MSEKNGEKAKEIVKKFRENERVHTDEWDETRYLEQRIKQGFDQKDREYEALMGVLVGALEKFGSNSFYCECGKYGEFYTCDTHLEAQAAISHPLVQEYLNKEKKP